jgi:hypothetical protein
VIVNVRIAAAVLVFAAVAAGNAVAGQPAEMQEGAKTAPQQGPIAQAWETASVVNVQLVQGIKAELRMAALPGLGKAPVPPEMKKETHRLMLELTDPRSGRKISRGTVHVRVIAPDKKVQTRGMMSREERYVADLELAGTGRYAVSVDFVLRDRRPRSARFFYEVK